MDATLQVVLSISVPTLAILIGILINNSRLSDLRSYMDVRISDLRETLRSDMGRMEAVMDARLTRIEQELKMR